MSEARRDATAGPGEPLIRLADEGDVVRIALHRPPLNIMTLGMLEELNQALAGLADRPGLRAVVFGAEGKAFSAGVAVEDHLGDRVKPMLESFHRVFRQLRALDCATVAAVQGACLGGASELATFCDLVIAAEAATFGQPEIKVGVFPPIAALHYPARIGVARTLRLLLTGEVVGAAEALRLGLVDQVVPAAELRAAVDAVVGQLRGVSALVLQLTKRAVRTAHGRPFDEALSALEELYHGQLMTTADAEEGLRAFVEKRKPAWTNR
jgi:cyclohexa-1,5-dienecarbonyl-CoA hydratase